MRKILVLMLVFSVLFCNTFIAVSAEGELITFDHIASDGTVNQADLSAFAVSVDESVDVSGVELIADGISLGEDTETPFCFALDESTLGERKVEAIVRDSSGAYYYAEKKFTVVEYTKGTVYSTDFASYNGGAGNVGGTHWISNQGLPVAFDRGDENGICLKLSYPEGDHAAHNCNNVCDQWPQFRHTGNDADKNRSTNVHFETDFYIDQSEKGPGRGWSVYGWNAFGPTADGNKSNKIVEILVNDSETVISCAGQKFPIQQKEWYRIVFEYDWKSGNTSLWVDGEQKVKNVIIPRDNEITRLTWIQGGGAVYGGSVCFDNWDMWMIFSSPCGTGLADAAEEHTYTENSVTLGLTQGISRIDTSALKLSNEIGEVKIEATDVSLEDQTITITPVGGFLPSNTYELTIPTKTGFTGGELTKPLKLRFTTSPAVTDVVSGKIKKGADVHFSTELINTSGAPRTLTAYLCSYKNGVFHKLTKAEAVVSSDGLKVTATTEPIEKGAGMTYKAFVADENGKPVSDKFYILEIG